MQHYFWNKIKWLGRNLRCVCGMFWAYNLKHFFKLNIKIDAGENIHKSGGKNMLYDNKDRMIQIKVYGTGVNKTFWVKIFGNYNAQHEHSQHKLLPGQKKERNKERKKEKEHFCLFFLNLILFVATRVALIPRDRFCGIADRWSYTIIKSTFFVLIMRSKYLVFQN